MLGSGAGKQDLLWPRPPPIIPHHPQWITKPPPSPTEVGAGALHCLRKVCRGETLPSPRSLALLVKRMPSGCSHSRGRAARAVDPLPKSSRDPKLKGSPCLLCQQRRRAAAARLRASGCKSTLGGMRDAEPPTREVGRPLGCHLRRRAGASRERRRR